MFSVVKFLSSIWLLLIHVNGSKPAAENALIPHFQQVKLPSELWMNVCDHSPIQTLLQLNLVCKYLHSFIQPDINRIPPVCYESVDAEYFLVTCRKADDESIRDFVNSKSLCLSQPNDTEDDGFGSSHLIFFLKIFVIHSFRVASKLTEICPKIIAYLKFDLENFDPIYSENDLKCLFGHEIVLWTNEGENENSKIVNLLREHQSIKLWPINKPKV